MVRKIKKNALLLFSIVIVLFSVLLYVQSAFAEYTPPCRSCGGHSWGGECYAVNLGGEACLFDTYGACHTAGSCQDQ